MFFSMILKLLFYEKLHLCPSQRNKMQTSLTWTIFSRPLPTRTHFTWTQPTSSFHMPNKGGASSLIFKVHTGHAQQAAGHQRSSPPTPANYPLRQQNISPIPVALVNNNSSEVSYWGCYRTWRTTFRGTFQTYSRASRTSNPRGFHLRFLHYPTTSLLLPHQLIWKISQCHQFIISSTQVRLFGSTAKRQFCQSQSSCSCNIRKLPPQ